MTQLFPKYKQVIFEGVLDVVICHLELFVQFMPRKAFEDVVGYLCLKLAEEFDVCSQK